MKQYTLNDARLPELSKNLNKVLLQLLLAVIPVALAVAICENFTLQILQSVIAPVSISAIVFVIVFKKTAEKQVGIWRSYALTIGPNTITREQQPLPVINIYKSEIISIVKTKEGAFVINTKNKADMMMVPFIVADAYDLQEQLQEIMPVTLQDKPHILQRYMVPFLALMLASMYLAIRANSLYLQIPSALIFCGITIGNLIAIRNSKNIVEKVRRSIWFTLIPVSAVLFNVVNKIIMHFQQ